MLSCWAWASREVMSPFSYFSPATGRLRPGGSFRWAQALLRLLGLLLERYAFGLIEVALGEHGLDLNVCDVARNDLLGSRFGCGLGLFCVVRAASREKKRRSQCRE